MTTAMTMGGALAEAVRAAVAAERALSDGATARLRGDLDATEHALLDARARLDAVADALGLPAEWDAEWGDRIAAERARREAAEAECTRLRVELAAVRSAVRMLDGARAAIDANAQRVLRSIAGEERAALIEELDAARRERDDWNARATAMEAQRDAQRTRADAAEAECARLRECLARANATLEATERARYAAEEERDTALELVAPDAVEAARQRDARDAERLAALVVARVALADARASHAALAAAVRAERSAREESDAAWADYITADAGAAEVRAIDARLDAARAALDAALEAL